MYGYESSLHTGKVTRSEWVDIVEGNLSGGVYVLKPDDLLVKTIPDNSGGFSITIPPGTIVMDNHVYTVEDDLTISPEEITSAVGSKEYDMLQVVIGAEDHTPRVKIAHGSKLMTEGEAFDYAGRGSLGLYDDEMVLAIVDKDGAVIDTRVHRGINSGSFFTNADLKGYSNYVNIPLHGSVSDPSGFRTKRSDLYTTQPDIATPEAKTNHSSISYYDMNVEKFADVIEWQSLDEAGIWFIDQELDFTNYVEAGTTPVPIPMFLSMDTTNSLNNTMTTGHGRLVGDVLVLWQYFKIEFSVMYVSLGGSALILLTPMKGGIDPETWKFVSKIKFNGFVRFYD